MQYLIQVSKPCNESWDGMTPESNGRHCAQCCKTVVDFSGWQEQDIILYLQAKAGTEVCGRFRTKQVNKPIEVYHFVTAVAESSLSIFRKIAAIFFLAFGMLQLSADAQAQTQKQPYHVKAADTAKPRPEHVLMGKPSMPHHTTKADTVRKPGKIFIPPPAPNHLMGEAVAMPQHAAKADTMRKQPKKKAAPKPPDHSYMTGDVALEEKPEKPKKAKHKNETMPAPPEHLAGLVEFIPDTARQIPPPKK